MIRGLCTGEGRHVVEPFIERTPINGLSGGLSCAGYDIRTKQGMTLGPGRFALLSTIEHFWMPRDVLGRVADKSTWARRGLAVQNTVIEPDWRGWLTVEVSNHNRHQPLIIQAGDPIAQVIFEQMLATPERAYSGRYQDQEDRPVEAIRLSSSSTEGEPA
ncbi:dCTP deaminase [Methylobacterium brachiatum]|nr:dCTP deaminase [Methylobacterium brachiatum]